MSVVVVVVVVVSAAFSSLYVYTFGFKMCLCLSHFTTLPSSVVSCFCFFISSRPETSSI
jgi:hypothetical protein